MSERFTAMAGGRPGPRGAPEAAAVSLRFAQDALGTVLYTCRARQKTINLQVITEDGSVCLGDGIFGFGATTGRLFPEVEPERDKIFELEVRGVLRCDRKDSTTPSSPICRMRCERRDGRRDPPVTPELQGRAGGLIRHGHRRAAAWVVARRTPAGASSATRVSALVVGERTDTRDGLLAGVHGGIQSTGSTLELRSDRRIASTVLCVRSHPANSERIGVVESFRIASKNAATRARRSCPLRLHLRKEAAVVAPKPKIPSLENTLPSSVITWRLIVFWRARQVYSTVPSASWANRRLTAAASGAPRGPGRPPAIA